jgi:hypothetical protein
VPFDLVQGDDPLTAERLLQMATQKEKQWQNLLSSVSNRIMAPSSMAQLMPLQDSNLNSNTITTT